MSDMNPVPGTDPTDDTASGAEAAPDGQDQDQGEGNEITVVIELDTQSGEFMVGLLPPGQTETGGGGGEGEESSESQWMQPAKDIGDALRMAKKLLEEPQAQSGGQSPFEQGYAEQGGGGIGGALTGAGQ